MYFLEQCFTHFLQILNGFMYCNYLSTISQITTKPFKYYAPIHSNLDENTYFDKTNACYESNKSSIKCY